MRDLIYKALKRLLGRSILAMANSIMMVFLLVSFLWSLASATVVTFPHITFMGQSLPSNSYVSFGRLELGGFNNGNGIICHTSDINCCSDSLAKWIFPNGSDVGQDGVLESIRLSNRVELHRGAVSGNIPSGVYQCNIAISGQTTGTANIGLYDDSLSEGNVDGHA